MSHHIYSDEQVLAAWHKLQNVAAVAHLLHCAKPTIYARLAKFREQAIIEPEPEPEPEPVVIEEPPPPDYSDVPLRDWLIDAGPPEEGEGHILDRTPSARARREEAQRADDLRQAWWFPRCECLSLEVLPHGRYRIEIATNQVLSPGDVEAIFIRGVPAVHRARGDQAPEHSFVAQGGDEEEP